MVRPDLLGGGGGESDLVEDRPRAPGFADAEAVHVADAHVGDHLRWWHDDGLHVAHGVDAQAAEPVVQPHGVGAGGEGLGKGQRRTAFLHMLGQLRAVAHAGLTQLLGQGDGLAILIQPHQHCHVPLRPCQAELGAVHHAVEHMGGIQFAGVELVAHAGPGGLLAGIDGQAVLLAKTLGGGDHHRSAIGQGNEADV